MKLTQKQESLIAAYLRDTAAQLDSGLSKGFRERSLGRVKGRIYRDLEALPGNKVDNNAVAGVLKRLGSPARVAELITAKAKPAPGGAGTEDAIWLGVCAGLAERLGIEIWAVRILALLLGMTGPLAILIYLCGYAALRRAAPGTGPPINPWRVVVRTGVHVAIASALYFGANGCVRLAYYLYREFIDQAMPEIGEWAWLEARAGGLFFWVLACALPLSVLSAMPLPNAWDHSLKRLVQAGLALYGAALSFGIASTFVGLILAAAKGFT